MKNEHDSEVLELKRSKKEFDQMKNGNAHDIDHLIAKEREKLDKDKRVQDR